MKWHINWKTSLLLIIALPILLRLGFWQLDRAEQKRVIEAQYAMQSAALPVQAADLFNSGSAVGLSAHRELAYRRVELSGRYLEHYTVFLDNQIDEGKPGYHVLTLFEVDSGGYAWVNRGWLAGKLDRSMPAMPSTPKSPVMIMASIYVPLGKPVILAADQWPASWPLRVQAVDLPRLSRLLQAELPALAELPAAKLSEHLLPYTLRLERAAAGALAVDWQVVNTEPAKHTGYAVQWFAMAAALLIFWLYWALRDPSSQSTR